MKKEKTILTLLLLVAIPVSAQKLIGEKTTVDVGRTGYENPVTAVFEFRNKSYRKLRISEVIPDCYCTTVEYPKEPVGAHDKFQIKMTYNARQLGHFDKQAAIVSNGSDKPVYIRMTGVVLSDYIDFAGTYPVEMGDLRLDKDELEFDDINRGDIQVQEIHIYNNSSKVYHPNLMHLPDYLTAVVTPERLDRGRAGKITVTLNSAKLRDYGLTQTTIYLAGNPGDKVSHDHSIDVSAIQLPSFDGMNIGANAPHIQLSKEKVDIDFEGKTKKSDMITITNTGQSELKISSLQLFTGGLKVSLNKRNLQPGEMAKLKIKAYRDDLKKARLRPRILMIVNDPKKPKVTITINAK